MMMRLSVVLLVALVASALFLVRVQYDSRRLYAELNKATTGYAEKVDERLGRISNAAES